MDYFNLPFQPYERTVQCKQEEGSSGVIACSRRAQPLCNTQRNWPWTLHLPERPSCEARAPWRCVFNWPATCAVYDASAYKVKNKHLAKNRAFVPEDADVSTNKTQLFRFRTV